MTVFISLYTYIWANQHSATDKKNKWGGNELMRKKGKETGEKLENRLPCYYQSAKIIFNNFYNVYLLKE